MMRLIHSLLKSRLLQLTLACFCLANPAHAFVDLAPTLAKIIADSQRICLVEVVQFNHESHTLVLKGVRAIKGDLDGNPIQHDVAAAGGSLVPRSIQQWAAPGARGVLFLSR
ncbi:MAG: hypothetical protein ABSG04_04045, partial [Verrucomicrobiota bacterium]